MNFVEALALCQKGYDAWKAKPHNKKWWKHVDGTPIPNDLLVCIAQAIAEKEKLEIDGHSFHVLTRLVERQRQALTAARVELHEMELSQRHGNPPRNPELTQAVIALVTGALEGK
jgi:hypothetical protein